MFVVKFFIDSAIKNILSQILINPECLNHSLDDIDYMAIYVAKKKKSSQEQGR